MKEKPCEQYDLIILGGGPAGLAAAIYGGRSKLKTLLLEKGTPGGRAYTTREIVNYAGIASASGPKLTEAMVEHVKGFGVDIRREEATSTELQGIIKKIETRKHVYEAKAVILAMGTAPRLLGIPGEKEFTGRGVAYCATCDAQFFQDQTVVVVGSGDQGIEESLYIAKYAREVFIVVLHEEGILDCNRQSAETAMTHPKIKFIWNSILEDIQGGENVNGVHIKNIQTGSVTLVDCQGVFLFVGMVPNTGLVRESVRTSQQGWILTDEQMETNCPGVYAAGDIREKYLRQICTSVADGAIAATAAQRYLEEMEYFENRILQSSAPVMVGFWTPDFSHSLNSLREIEEINQSLETPLKFFEIDVSRKKTLARYFAIDLKEEQPAAALVLRKGKILFRADLGDLDSLAVSCNTLLGMI